MNEKPFHSCCYALEYPDGYDRQGHKIPQSLLFHFHLIDRRIKYAILDFEPANKYRNKLYVKTSLGRKFLSAYCYDDYYLSYGSAACFPKVEFNIVLSNVIYA